MPKMDPKIVFLDFVFSAFGGYIAPQMLKKSTPTV